VDPTDPARVVGVQLDDGQEIAADLVVDAGGRRSASGRWLRELGIEPPATYEEPVDRRYYCRHYRLREGERYPADDVPIVQPLPYATVLVFIGDNRTYSVAVELSAQDPLKQRFQDPAVFDRFLEALPMTAAWQERSEAVSDLHVMAGLSNRRRRLVLDGRSPASGIALVGDASQYTNPALGQGVSLTFWMAQTLAELVERVHDDPSHTAAVYEAWVDDELGPRFQRQLRVDREANRQLLAGLRGEGFIAPAEDDTRFIGAVLTLATEDHDLLDRARRVGHLLDRPGSLREDHALRERVGAVLREGPPVVTGEGPLTRSQFNAIVTA
jgi:2-polyprenyl-6-methoxyphenol hydroxylase-like FAD-dependent oxidoreductase